MIAIHLISFALYGCALACDHHRKLYDMCTMKLRYRNVRIFGTRTCCTINVLSVSVSLQWIAFIFLLLFLFHVIANCTIEFIVSCATTEMETPTEVCRKQAKSWECVKNCRIMWATFFHCYFRSLSPILLSFIHIHSETESWHGVY